MINYGLILATLLAAGGDVDVTTTDGESLRGQIVDVSSDDLQLLTDGKSKVLSTRVLMSVVPVDPPREQALPDAYTTVKLIDGSLLRVTSYTVESGTATVELVGKTTAEIRTRSIAWVCFGKPTDKAWQKILKEDASGDVLVIAKTTATGVKTLDYLEGVLLDGDAKQVQFEFDGDKIDVAREKVGGLVYFHDRSRTLPDPLCIIHDTGHATWHAKSLRFDGDVLSVSLVSGVRHEFPDNTIRKFDFSAGKIVYLSDMDPHAFDWTPVIPPINVGMKAAASFQYRRDRSFSGEQLSVGNTRYAKGLGLHSRSQVTYSLDGKYSNFATVAGIDDSRGNQGHVRLKIEGDRKILFDKEIAGGEQPQKISLDIEGVRRLRITVDYGKGYVRQLLDIGDHLDLCDAKVAK